MCHRRHVRLWDALTLVPYAPFALAFCRTRRSCLSAQPAVAALHLCAGARCVQHGIRSLCEPHGPAPLG